MKRKWILFVVSALAGWTVIGATAWSETGAEVSFRQGYKASIAREWDEAVTWFTRSIELNPQNAEAYFQRAVAFEMMDRVDEAISDYEAALQLQPDYYLCMEYLAKLYEKKGDYVSAVEIYRHALPLVKDPKWRSIVQWWISEARKKIKDPQSQNKPRASRQGR